MRAPQALNLDRDEGTSPGPSVLVVDESSPFRDELARTLRSEGYEVLTAATGEEGLRLAAESRPNAILVDGILPRMDGATLIRRVRLDPVLRRTPCVMLTETDDAAAELRALDAGADLFVKKDEEPDIVMARVKAVLRSSSIDDERAVISLLGARKILAVDNSDSYLQVLAEAIAGEGFEVILAHSGEEALEKLSKQRVDCILLDLLMPGIGGQETCRRIKQAPGLRDIPLIILTALEDRNAMVEGLAAGADDYVSKMSDFEILRARLRAQLRRRQFEEENRHNRNQLLRAELEAAEARAARELAETRARLVEELQQKNRELESFSYTVSHDLRAPLRTIDGFTTALAEDYGPMLDERANSYIQRVTSATRRMSELIEDLLALSRLGRAAIHCETVDLSALVGQIARELIRAAPQRKVELLIQPGVKTQADPRMTRVLLENLLSNAFKFTLKTVAPRIEFGVSDDGGTPTYFVADNGAGFDMALAEKLFSPFQRLHADADYPGTGVGLATVRRIVERHGGHIRAEGQPGQGARFEWTLGCGGNSEQP
jgi:DNA-binding response OmpR family regulator